MAHEANFSWKYLRDSSPLIEIMGVFGAVAILLNEVFGKPEYNPIIFSIAVASCFTIFLMVGYIFMKKTLFEIIININTISDIFLGCRDIILILIFFTILFVSLSLSIVFTFSEDIIRIMVGFVFMVYFLCAIVYMRYFFAFFSKLRASIRHKPRRAVQNVLKAMGANRKIIYFILFLFYLSFFVLTFYVSDSSIGMLLLPNLPFHDVTGRALISIIYYFTVLILLDLIFMPDDTKELIRNKLRALLHPKTINTGDDIF